MKKAGLIFMTVFISSSGKKSNVVALILHNWLEEMFDTIIEFVSSTDFETGSHWRDSLNEAMSSADCALLCVTRENVNSPWLVYEAGALNENVETLIPVLFGVSPLRLRGPLRMFQPVPFDFDDMRALTAQLNQLCGEDRLPAQELERRFQARYPVAEALIEEKLSEDGPLTDNLDEKLDAILSRLSELERKSNPSLPDREAGA